MKQVTESDAIRLAQQFAERNELSVTGVKFVTHVTGEELEHELGFPHENGMFLIEFRIPPEERPAACIGDSEPTIAIKINDCTGAPTFVTVLD